MTLLYRARVGSHAYGTNTDASDEDFIEVHIEESRFVTGIDKTETKFVSNEGRTPVGGEDTTVYGLNKWAYLVAQGNPNMIETLFIPNELDAGLKPGFHVSRGWRDLIANRGEFISQESGRRFLGYAVSQRLALTGMRNKRTNRPELVHTHGYDTKFGGHMIRVLVEGIHLMRYGVLEMPLPPEDRNLILDIRAGKVPKQECLDIADELTSDLEHAIENTDLPKKANRAVINNLLHSIYLDAWRGSARF